MREGEERKKEGRWRGYTLRWDRVWGLRGQRYRQRRVVVGKGKEPSQEKKSEVQCVHAGSRTMGVVVPRVTSSGSLARGEA